MITWYNVVLYIVIAIFMFISGFSFAGYMKSDDYGSTIKRYWNMIKAASKEKDFILYVLACCFWPIVIIGALCFSVWFRVKDLFRKIKNER